jgi:hypothetical protein
MRSTTPSKPFSPELHAENDGPAKDAVMAFIKRAWNLEPREAGKYDCDLDVYEKGALIAHVEVEKRSHWTGDFPFATVNVPTRKRKFFLLDLPTLLFSVKADFTQALYTRGDIILDSPIVDNPNRYLKEEKFFSVPLRYWKLVTL